MGSFDIEKWMADRRKAEKEAEAITAGMSEGERKAYATGVRQAMKLLDRVEAGMLTGGDIDARQWKAVHEARQMLGYMTGAPVAEEVGYDARLRIVAETFRAVVAHAREGGSYRHLIYGRLWFNEDAYAPLLEAGGMDISNEFNLSEKPWKKGKR